MSDQELKPAWEQALGTYAYTQSWAYPNLREHIQCALSEIKQLREENAKLKEENSALFI
jgi:hypothetical protein